MMADWSGRVKAVVPWGLLALAMALSPPALAQADAGIEPGTVEPFDDTPPLRPGEFFRSFRNRCEAVVRAYDPATPDEGRWTGDCAQGLAHGSGEVVAANGIGMPTRYVYGRLIIAPPARQLGQSFRIYRQASSGQWREWNLYVERDFDPALIGSAIPPVTMLSPDTGYVLALNLNYRTIDDQGRYVATEGETGIAVQALACSTENSYSSVSDYFPDEASKQRIRQTCRRDRRALIHFVTVRNTPRWRTAEQHPTNFATTNTLCSDPTSLAGCMGEYRQAVEPLLDISRQIIAGHLANYANEPAELEAMMQPWMAALEQHNAAVSAQMEAEASAARALDEEERAAFTASLQTANAGELFAMADEQAEQDDIAGAREALRALIRRFPNSPLVGPAAERLSDLAQ